MLKVWGRANSINVQKVMWAIGEIDLEHERIDVGGPFGGLDSERYGRLNPNRLIPTVEDGEVVIWESHACLRYLAARYDPNGLWLEDVGQRALADQWIDWKITRVLPPLTTCFWGLIRTAEADRDLPAIARATQALAQIWPILDRHLAGRTFIASDRLTLGDLPLGCAFYRYQALPLERPSLPHVEAWYERLASRPAFRRQVMIPLS